MNYSYSKDFIKSFEETIFQKRFEELENCLRMYKYFTKLYENNALQCRKVLSKDHSTVESQKLISQINSIDSIVKKYKKELNQFEKHEEKEKEIEQNSINKSNHRKVIKPSPKELERLQKTMSMPVIKMNKIINKEKIVETKKLMKEFEGQFYQMTKYSSGCNLLMKFFENANEEIIDIIFDEIHEHIPSLIIHQNGQYILPKMTEFGKDSVKDFIFEKIRENLIEYCCNIFGGYTIQKTAPFMKQKHILSFTPILQDNIYTLIMNPHGNYVIQTLLKTFDEKYSDFFYEGINKDLVHICKTKIGCSVLTNSINNSTKQQLKKIEPEILLHVNELINDQYGNFILQHLIENDNSIVPPIIKTIFSNVVFYCNDKYSSNVVEKCLLNSSDKSRNELIKVLMQKDILTQLIEDQYGKFVIQTLVDSLTTEQPK